MTAVPPWQTPNAVGNGAEDRRVGLAGVLTSMTRTPDGPMKNTSCPATASPVPFRLVCARDGDPFAGCSHLR
jgi:hypothetical protein